MSRRKTAAELTRQLEYARRREARAAQEPAPKTGAPNRRPKIAVKYGCTSEAATEYTVQASQPGVQFFGGVAPLGLAVAEDDPTPPAGFKPNRILAMVADASPSYVRAEGSGRDYIRYARGARGSGTQSTFSSPISDTSTPTMASVRTKFGTVANAIRANLGGPYGRVWFEAERLPLAESGQ
ncbi:hypothetical protein LEP3755_01710 [Leptolyngbya sp. NIES-3755]|nr:hypothetical protein LEP3755_01710 [Leptolyngbya sp. NIES-3755]